MNALQHFEAFCSVNGPQFYGLPVNDTFIELVREEQQVAESIALTDDNSRAIPRWGNGTLVR